MKPSALILADIHAREDKPRCRTDNFFDTMAHKILFLKEICEKYNIPAVIAGDIFHQAGDVNQTKRSKRYKNPSPYLIRMLISNMPKFIATPGNHDLFGHSMEFYDKSGLAVLEAAGLGIIANKENPRTIFPGRIWKGQDDWVVFAFPYGVELHNPKRAPKNKRLVCVAHQMVIQTETESVIKNVSEGSSLLKKFNSYDLIATGDNHKCFVEKYHGRLLINQGGISRQEAGQKNVKPKVFLWFSHDNSFEEIDIPIERDVITVRHIEKEKIKDNMIDEYIDNVKLSGSTGINLRKNFETHLINNNVEKGVSQIIWKGLDS